MRASGGFHTYGQAPAISSTDSMLTLGYRVVNLNVDGTKDGNAGTTGGVLREAGLLALPYPLLTGSRWTVAPQ